MPQRLAQAGFDPASPIIHHLIALVNELVGFPRHLSQHVGGFVISRGPLSRLVPLENAAMAARTVIQRDKNDPEAFARQIFQQIQGFGEYGFPESHAASFALLVYVSAWLKHHEPAAFACVLLNSQPMGFYAPSQLVQDTRRHGVEVRPVTVAASNWDCTLEDEGTPALQLGLRMVKGLPKAGATRLTAARAAALFVEVEDLARRAALAAPGEGAELLADYASLGLTLGRHPLALLRDRLQRRRMVTAVQLHGLPNGRLVRATGLVTSRQRPDSAGGVIFVTLEDETGLINVVVWHDLAQRQRRELLGSTLLGVYGRLERQGEVVHLIAGRLVDHSGILEGLAARSRDFH